MSETATAKREVSKHFTPSILLWMRTDKPRQAGMDRWRGPHSGIISATPGIETTIPEGRRIDGIAEVTFENALSPLAGRKQTALAL